MLCPCPLILVKRESDQKSSRLIRLVALVFCELEMVLLGFEIGGVIGLLLGDSSSRMVTVAWLWFPRVAPPVGLVRLMVKDSFPSTLLSFRMRIALGLFKMAFWTGMTLLISFSAKVMVMGLWLKSLLIELAAQAQPLAVPSLKVRVAVTVPVRFPLRMMIISVMAVPSSVTV